MKKILIFMGLFVLTILVNTDVVSANAYYNAVNIKTTFDEKIDLAKIDEIEVHLEDATEYSKDYILEKSKNFELLISDVPVGPYNFIYGVVIGDEIGYYSVLATVNIDSVNNSVQVLVNVSESNSNKTTTTTPLTQDEVDKIIGNETTTTSKNNSTDVIIDDDEENNNQSSNSTTTTIPKDVEDARKEEELEAKKKATRKKNSLIGKIMFSLIGIVLIVCVIYAMIKISNANK